VQNKKSACLSPKAAYFFGQLPSDNQSTSNEFIIESICITPTFAEFNPANTVLKIRSHNL
jgi:hypothetical protein